MRTRLAAEVANALHYLHTQRPEGVLHQRIRPSNILLDDDGTARLGDVGLASLLQDPLPAVRGVHDAPLKIPLSCFVKNV